MAVITPTGGPNLNAVPAPVKQTLSTNYLSFTGGQNDWSQQYLPELYEAEVERYGDRTVSSFLRMVGAEMPMASDQVVWSEQGRLHLSYEDATLTTAATGLITISGGHAIRVGQTVVLSDGTTTTKGYVATTPSATTLTVLPYDTDTLDTNYNDAATI